MDGGFETALLRLLTKPAKEISLAFQVGKTLRILNENTKT
jgi:hypothetical protein